MSKPSNQGSEQKSKFFRIATEGATTDGRVIQRVWLTQMAANYDPKVYGARLNLEHIRGLVPDSPFRAYGDVMALETREEDGKLRLYAQIKPNAELVALTKAGQKVYTSCEINPKFADTGEAYLVGLAITDNPASLGTDVLSFAAQNPDANPFKSKKLHPDNLFTAATEEVTIELEAPSTMTVLLSKVQGILGRKSASDDERFNDLGAALEEVAIDAKEKGDTIAKLTAQVSTLTTDLAKAVADVAALTAKLSGTPANPARPLATGGSGKAEDQTDC